jgi:hypothetical protein
MLHALQMIRQFFQTAARKLSRRWLHLRMRNQPASEVLAAERRLRGKDQLKLLQRADVVVVSFGKSGRTWVRVMMSHLFRTMYRLPDNALLGFDNFYNMNRQIPRIFFTHDNYIKDFTGDAISKQPYYGKRVILVARDPRDVAVSQFFQWKFRLKPGKVAINNYPDRDSDMELYEFVTGDNGGSIQAVCDYLNLWASEAGSIDSFHLVRYEDLRKNPQHYLGKILEFMQVEATEKDIETAVELSSVENMRKQESSGRFKLAGARMVPGDKSNPDSYKVRRAKVGGYRDYFDDEEVAAIDLQLARRLDPLYSYSSTPGEDDLG